MLKKIECLICLLFLWGWFPNLLAHGSMEIPVSRIYRCYQEGPENVQSDACKAFVAMSGKQPLYDWDMINQANANGNHKAIIPDGTLCAGGRDKYKGLNMPRLDWFTTPIKADATGRFNFIWRATVPHAIKYFELYITNDNYNFANPLTWADLETPPFCTITSSPLVDGRYQFNCPVPKKSGKRILFAIWQRIDSAEAFYSCSDISLDGAAVSWQKLSDLIATNAVLLNSTIRLWLIKDCNVVEEQDVPIGLGQTAPNEWPYALALAVNAKSVFLRIGQLNSQTNVITPIKSATLNQVYLNNNETNRYYFVLEFLKPGQTLTKLKPPLPRYCNGVRR